MTPDPATCRQLAVDILMGRPLTAESTSALLRELAAAAETAERVATLESELATLRASVVDALSSAGPEVGEDERTT